GKTQLPLGLPSVEVVRRVDGLDLDARVGLALVAHTQNLRLLYLWPPHRWPQVQKSPRCQAPGGASRGCGMQSSSYSAITISAACSPHARQSGSRLTLNTRNDSWRAAYASRRPISGSAIPKTR